MGDWRRMTGIAVLLAGALPVAACAKPVADGDNQIGAAGNRRSASATPGIQASAGGQGAPGLTLRQFQQRREQRILAADTDHDGKVSLAEFTAAMANGKADPARRFARLDRNGDGRVDRQEIAAMAARRFGRIDADGDGRVTKAERKGGAGPARAGRSVRDDAE